MGFFAKLFGRGDALPAASQVVSSPLSQLPPPKGIGYHRELVPALLDDHAQLGALYARVGEAQRRGNAALLQQSLGQLKSRLNAHVLAENVRFYNYLEQSLQADPTNLGLIHEFRREMNQVVRQVQEFINRYLAPQLSAADMAGFAADYERVRELLERRFDNEEHSLYPLYRAV